MTAELSPTYWRRPGCDERCWREAVLVVGERQTRVIESHDPDAHEDYIREAFGAPTGHRWRGAIQFGPLRIDFSAEAVSVLSMPVADLSPREWGVLQYLARRPGQVVSCRELIGAIWGEEYLLTANGTEMVRTIVMRLRRKLREGAPLIETRPRRGYCLRLELPREISRLEKEAAP
jgi:DNA-binding response OmpR family regulator